MSLNKLKELFEKDELKCSASEKNKQINAVRFGQDIVTEAHNQWNPVAIDMNEMLVFVIDTLAGFRRERIYVNRRLPASGRSKYWWNKY